ncbi:4a-hydroxytetrahydrobiopterin dehydratase PWA37_005115 [Arxiozyma heterogenica]
MYNKIYKMNAVKIPLSELNTRLVTLGLSPNWTIRETGLKGYTLRRKYTFSNFEATWSFLIQVSMRAHLWGHHPTIHTIYNKVELELITHDLDNGCISDIDLKLAKQIESYINLYKSQENGQILMNKQ